MKISKLHLTTKKICKYFVVAAALQITACGKLTTDSEQISPEEPQISDNVIDVSKAVLIQSKPTYQAEGKIYQVQSIANTNAFNATGTFTYPTPATEFTGNISVSFEAADEQGIKQVLIGFVGSNSAITICEQNCGNTFSAFVNGINPLLFGLSTGEQIITLWVEDNEGNVSQASSLNVNWRQPVISGVSASINADTEELTISWSALTNALRYNVYISNDVNLSGSNYPDLTGGDAQLALKTTNATFTDKSITSDYYILVTGVDGSGESAFSDKIILLNGNESLTPIANADAFTTDEDITLTGNVLTNDSGEGDTITASTTPLLAPANGTVTIEVDGEFTYTPNANFNGTDQFSYTIQNSQGLTSNNTVSITITPSNDIPIANDISFVIESDTLVVAKPGVLQNDSDIDGDTLTALSELLKSPQFGELALQTDGSFEYKKGDNFTTYDEFVYTLSDGTDASQTATVTITTPEFNGYPPVAINDKYTTNEDTLLTINVSNGILSNDFDNDSLITDLTLSISQNTTNGELVIADDGSFSYTPNANFYGLDEFHYSLTDTNNNIAYAVVTIDVVAQNDAPTALNDAYFVQANSLNDIPSVFGLLVNDTDIDQDDISVVIDTITMPSSGALDINADGSFSYTPNDNFIGTDSFTYQITDSTLTSAYATVQLSALEVIASTDDETPITINLSDLTNGLDEQYELIGISALNGTVLQDGDELTYTPTAGFDGIDSITMIYSIDGVEYSISFNIGVVSTSSTLLSDIIWDDPTISQCISNNYNFEYTSINDVSYIYCSGTIETLSDLSKLPNLYVLNLYSATVNDWSALSDLNLHEFIIQGGTNFSAANFDLLESHSNLTYLSVYSMSFTEEDWSFLSSFNLNYLSIHYSNFTDLTLLTHMTNLTSLNLSGNSINDWSVLSQLDLTQFSVSDSTFNTLSLLSSMDKLTFLSLYNISLTNESDWSQLTSFTNLNSLYIASSNITDLTPLTHLTNLKALDLSYTSITDFSVLSDLTLNFLAVDSTSFSDLTDLSGSTDSLTYLNISNSQVSDFSGLSSFTNLTQLQAYVSIATTQQNAVLLELYNNGVEIYSAPDGDYNGVFDFLEDIDGDGLLNSVDDDDDGDGVLDSDDAYPFDATKSELEDLAADADFSSFTLSSGFTDSDQAWFSQTEYSTTGGAALRSGAISANQKSIVQTTITAGEHGSVLSFDWKVSSESCCDKLQLLVDGEFINSISGNVDWQQYTISLTSGSHHIEWIYYKGASVDTGLDAGFLDNIQLIDKDNQAPIFKSEAPTQAYETERYEYYTEIEDYSATLTFTLTNAPTGMTVDSDGVVSWTPSVGDTTSDVVTLSVYDGEFTTTQDFTITVSPSNYALLSSLTWTDSTLEQCFNTYYPDAIYVYEITYLSCNGDFESLDDLTQLSSLTELNFTDSTIVDWDGLANLDLQGFSLHNTTDLDNFSLLKSLDNLTSLTLYDVHLSSESEWSFLTDLNINYLNLENSNFTDLSLLSHMSDLKYLLLSYSSVTDWQDIALFDLMYFTASGTTYSDLSLLSGMTDLQYLYLDYVNIDNADWTALANMVNLQGLHANYSNIDTLPSFADVPNLHFINIGGTAVTDFSSLSVLKLDSLTVFDTPFSDFADISASAESLTNLNITETSVSDLSELSSFINLHSLYALFTGSSAQQNSDLLELYNNGVSIFEAEDSNANDIFDFIEDIDGDGYLNDVDDDDDGDGVLDVSDAYPNEAAYSVLVDLSSALDYSDGVVSSSSDISFSRWNEQFTEYTTGTSAVQSGEITGSHQSVLVTEVDAGDDGATISFDWKVLSENGYGYIHLYVDESWIAELSNQTDWSSYTQTLSSGSHTIEWRYLNWTGDNNAAYVDNLSVTLLDTNYAPEFTSSTTASIDENTVAGTVVYTATATDNDSGDTLTYSFTNDMSNDDSYTFEIDSTTGVISVFDESQLDYESSSTLTLDIKVIDDSGEYDTLSVTLSLNDINDAPTITSSSTASVDENAASGTTAFTVIAEDEDSGDTLTYSFTNDSLFDDSYAFAINASSGEVSVYDDNQLDYEYYPSFTLDIKVTDSSSGTDTISVTVSVTDVNETPIIISDETIDVSEDAVASTTIYTITATEPDDQTLTYGFDDSSGLFSVDSSTGVITLDSASLDYETTPSYTFNVTATDTGSAVASQSVTINITNVNEAPEVTSDASVLIEESTAASTIVYTVTASDPENDTLRFEFDDNSGLFTLDEDSGEITLDSASLDYETTTSYSFNVEAIDINEEYSGLFTVTLNVTDNIENTDMVLDTTFGSNGLVEFNTYAEDDDDDYLVDAVMDDNGNRFVLVNMQDDNSGDNVHHVAKLKSDGSFDVTFGDNGRKHLNHLSLNDINVFMFDDYPSSSFTPRHLKVDNATGYIYILGYQYDGSTTEEGFILRLNSDGSIDETFADDGKYEHTPITTGDHSEAIDLVIHSNGSMYLASNSRTNSTHTKNFKLSKLTTAGSLVEEYSEYDLAGIAYDEYINGMVEDVNGDLAVFGHIDQSGDYDLIYTKIDITDLSVATNSSTASTYDYNGNQDEYINTYVKVDSNTIAIAGSTGAWDPNLDEVNPYIVVLNINDDHDANSGTPEIITIENQFDGFAASNLDAIDEEIISISVDSSGNFTFTTKTSPVSGYRHMYLTQITPEGGYTTLVNNGAELTDTSDVGIDSDDYIRAIVVQDPTDSNDYINVFSSFEKTNLSGFTEIETYYKQFDDTTELSRSDYDFHTVGSEFITSSLIHSSGYIFSSTYRDNTRSYSDEDVGTTITAHDATTGEWQQGFQQGTYPGSIHADGDDANYIEQYTPALYETNDGYIMSVTVELDTYSPATSITVDKVNTTGTSQSGFPITFSLSSDSYISDSAYNVTANKIALFGYYGQEPSYSMVVMIDASDGSLVYETQLGKVLGLDGNAGDIYNHLTSGIVEDDGSLIALGSGEMDGNNDTNYYNDTFLIRLDAAGELDLDFDNSSADDGIDGVLTVELSSNEDVLSDKIVQLSNGDIVFSANNTSGFAAEGYLVKLNEDDSNANQYVIDSTFDNMIDGSDADDKLTMALNDFADPNNLVGALMVDLLVDDDDNVIVIGNSDFGTVQAGFIAKFNGVTGDYDDSLGGQSIPGYFIPYGYYDCANYDGDVITSFCDLSVFMKGDLDSSGDLIIYTTNSSSNNSDNTFIIKFNLNQSDAPNGTDSTYTIPYSGGD